MGAGSEATLVLFGAPHLFSAGERHEIPDTAPAYLGLFLAAQSGWTSRETVAAYLWPDASTERAQHNLRVALNRLGALLQRWEVADSLQAERRRLRLDMASDLGEFRAALAGGDWARASALPSGPLLDGLRCATYPAMAEWLSIEREALRRSWRKALVEAAHIGTEIDTPLSKYVAAHPSDGEAASLLAARRAAAGRPLEAQDVIASFKRAAADELTQDELDAYLSRIEQTAAALTPSIQAVEALGVLGRQAELTELDAALEAHRWVTVVGLPGSGKSSLVRAWLAQRTASGRGAGLVLIQINERSTASSIAESIVSSLATLLAPRPGVVSPVALLAPLGGLVVLDGFDAASTTEDLNALLHTMATACPGLRVLAASRRPLGIAGEHAHRLRGLSVQRSAEQGRSDAARLFLREAQRMRPNHRWAELGDDVERIARLCEGLPLALKLAASWSRWLEPRAIAVELERSVRSTAGAFDDGLHEWLAAPWKRLTASQQQALCSLSLFPGSFDMVAAVAVSASSPSQVEALQTQCLIDFEPGPPARLRLHALVRQFAAARLNKTPVQRRESVGRYLALVNSLLGPRPMQSGQPVFNTSQVRPCLDEVMAAWPLALETGALEMMQGLAAALLAWHESMGEFRAGADRLAAALDALDEALPAEAAVLAGVQVSRATLLYRASDYDVADGLAREAQRLGAITGQRRIVRRALNVLGLSRWMTLRLDEARAAFQQGLASAIEDGERLEEARLSSNLALVENSQGNYGAAEGGWRRAIELDKSIGAWSGACNCLNNLANLLRHSRRFEECEVLAMECLRLTHEHALEAQRPFALMGLALLHRETGSLDRAAQYLALLDACREDSVEGPVRAGAAQLRAQMALDRGDGAPALQYIAQALRICIDNDDAANRAESLMFYGQWLARHDGRPEEALSLWSALWHAPAAHATLKDLLKRQFNELGHDVPAASAAAADIALCVEQALAVARLRSADPASPLR